MFDVLTKYRIFIATSHVHIDDMQQRMEDGGWRMENDITSLTYTVDGR